MDGSVGDRRMDGSIGADGELGIVLREREAGGGGHVGERAVAESHKLDLWPPGCGILILPTILLLPLGPSHPT